MTNASQPISSAIIKIMFGEVLEVPLLAGISIFFFLQEKKNALNIVIVNVRNNCEDFIIVEFLMPLRKLPLKGL